MGNQSAMYDGVRKCVYKFYAMLEIHEMCTAHTVEPKYDAQQHTVCICANEGVAEGNRDPYRFVFSRMKY